MLQGKLKQLSNKVSKKENASCSQFSWDQDLTVQFPKFQ